MAPASCSAHPCGPHMVLQKLTYLSGCWPSLSHNQVMNDIYSRFKVCLCPVMLVINVFSVLDSVQPGNTGRVSASLHKETGSGHCTVLRPGLLPQLLKQTEDLVD